PSTAPRRGASSRRPASGRRRTARGRPAGRPSAASTRRTARSPAGSTARRRSARTARRCPGTGGPGAERTAAARRRRRRSSPVRIAGGEQDGVLDAAGLDVLLQPLHALADQAPLQRRDVHHVDGAVEVVDLVLEDVRQLPLRRLLVPLALPVLVADAHFLRAVQLLPGVRDGEAPLVPV